MQLDAGHRIAAVGGSDDHRAGIDEGRPARRSAARPRSCSRTTSREAAIIDGVAHGRTIVAAARPGRSARGLTRSDGTRDRRRRRRRQRASRRTSTSPAATATSTALARRHEAEPDRSRATTSRRRSPSSPAPGDHRYRVELIDDTNQRIVVTSHIYVHASPPRPPRVWLPLDDAGVAPLLAFAFVLRRRRRAA